MLTELLPSHPSTKPFLDTVKINNKKHTFCIHNSFYYTSNFISFIYSHVFYSVRLCTGDSYGGCNHLSGSSRHANHRPQQGSS